MDRVRLAPLIAVLGCVLFVVVLAVPYGLVGAGPGSGVSTYYATGAINPLVGGLFAAIGVIVIAAGRSGRAEPALAAGVGVTLGLFLVAIASIWALTVPRSLVVGLGENALVEYHRWAPALVALVIPVASAVWARDLGVL